MNNPVPDLTICIAIGPEHEDIAARAMESVKRQTSLVLGHAFHDEAGKGAGYARNALLERVTTPFVAFLDADDWLEPEYASIMLEAAKNAGARYVYCGWWADEMNKAVSPPPRCYCFDNGCQVHPISAVVRTEWAKQIGGFDSDLPGMEDTDFFLKLTTAGHCGLPIDMPLFHWTAADEKSRSYQFQQRQDYQAIKAKIRQKYDRGTAMACCQGQGVTNEGPFGDKQPGDVLAEMMGPPRITVGIESRRIYPRVGYNARAWADPRDVARDPGRFRLVPQAIAQPPQPEGTILRNASDLAEVMEGFRTDGANVYLPQNEVQKPAPEKTSVGLIRKMAGF